MQTGLDHQSNTNQPDLFRIANRMLRMAIPAFFLLFVISYYTYHTEVSNDREMFMSQEHLKVSHQEQIFSRALHNIIEDLVILSYHNDLREMVNGVNLADDPHREAVIDEFLSFSSQKPQYHQIRLFYLLVW